MKNSFVIGLLFILSFGASAQESMDVVTDARAKELIRVISLSDKNEYRKFIKANYTEALINKKMKQNIQGPDGSSQKTEDKPGDALEAKVTMFERIHDDIGKGKILSMKREGEKLNLDVQGDTGTSLKFGLTFLKESPYLIDGLSIEMMMGR